MWEGAADIPAAIRAKPGPGDVSAVSGCEAGGSCRAVHGAIAGDDRGYVWHSAGGRSVCTAGSGESGRACGIHAGGQRSEHRADAGQVQEQGAIFDDGGGQDYQFGWRVGRGEQEGCRDEEGGEGIAAGDAGGERGIRDLYVGIEGETEGSGSGTPSAGEPDRVDAEEIWFGGRGGGAAEDAVRL